MIITNKPSTKAIATHGYIFDKNKQKMSKSLGNVVKPQDVIEQYSRDILRLAIASSDFRDDIIISDSLLKNVAEVYRKIRNTCRFMLANVHNFNHTGCAAVPDYELLGVDRYILSRLRVFSSEVLEAYEKIDFARAVKLINNFCVNDLSGLYLDIAKDRLYIEARDSKERRATQTTIWRILDVLTRLVAPVLPFLAEEVSDYYQVDKQQSIHLGCFHGPELFEKKSDSAAGKFRLLHGWTLLEMLRDAALKRMEEKRQAGVIKHSLEAGRCSFLSTQVLPRENMSVRFFL